MPGPILRTKRLKILEPLHDANSDEILVFNSETKEVSSLPKESVFDADNIKTEIAINAPVDPTAEGFADAINALPLFTIDGKTIPTFKAVTTGENPVVYYVELLNLGKGSYGVTGTQLTIANLKITTVEPTSKDIAELSSTQIIDLGNQGDDVVTAMNRQMPNITIQDQNDGYTIVKGIFLNGQFHEYLWIGTAGTYGRDVLQTTDQDFKELSSVSQGVARATDSYSGTVKTDVYKENPTVYVKETVDELLKGKANFFLAIKTITGISYNVIIDDILNELVYEGTLPMNVIIPNNATVPFPIGTIFYTLGTNTGILSASGGTGVVLKLKSGISLSALQNEVRQYTKTGINTWNVRGDLNLGAVTQTELSYLQGATSNLQAQINAKVTLNGTPGYLMKFLTAATATVSLIREVGNFIGIGTLNTPTKDLTFGNQGDRVIGVEDSDNSSNGKNLKIVSGRNLNYVPTVQLEKLNEVSYFVTTGIAADPNGDIYLADTYGNMYKRTNGAGNFFIETYGTGGCIYNTFRIAPNGDMYVASGGVMRKRTGRTGNFVAVTTPVAVKSLDVTQTGDVCIIGTNTDLYIQTGGVGAFVAQGFAIRNYNQVKASFNGDIWLQGPSNDMYVKRVGNSFLSNATFSSSAVSISSAPNGDMWFCQYAEIFKLDGTTGVYAFFGYDLNNFGFEATTVAYNGNVYFANYAGFVYMINNSGAGVPNLSGGNLQLATGTGKGNAPVRIEFLTAQKTASGTDMQIETLRAYIEENGYMVWVNMPVHADNASAITAGLPIGTEYRTATGDRKIVY